MNSSSPDELRKDSIVSWVSLVLSIIVSLAVSVGWGLILTAPWNSDVGDSFGQAILGFIFLAGASAASIITMPLSVAFALRAKDSTDLKIQRRGKAALVLQTFIGAAILVFLFVLIST